MHPRTVHDVTAFLRTLGGAGMTSRKLFWWGGSIMCCPNTAQRRGYRESWAHGSSFSSQGSMAQANAMISKLTFQLQKTQKHKHKQVTYRCRTCGVRACMSWMFRRQPFCFALLKRWLLPFSTSTLFRPIRYQDSVSDQLRLSKLIMTPPLNKKHVMS